MPELVVALSYFDRKVGPTVFIEYPEKIGEEEKMTLNQIFDQTTSEGWFWHSLNTKDFATSINYYFEIKSDWARGLKEMLMCSLIFKEKLNSEKEHEVLSWLTDFVTKMHGRPDLYKAFYSTSKTTLASSTEPSTESESETNQSYVIVLKWIKELYWSSKEEIRQKSEEEIIANLMINPAIYNTIRNLSKHPIRIGELHAWFDAQHFNRDFDKVISMLEEQKFIFINQIGPETYVLLVKDIDIFRVPPSCVLELFDKKELPQSVIEYYIGIVSEFFNNYNPQKDEKDKAKLFSIMSMPRHYNLITELRKKPVIKAQISNILRQGPVIATKINVIEDLKSANIIDETEYQGTAYLLLRTDINIVDQFPEYIQSALPEQKKIARIPMQFSFPKVSPELRDELKEMFGSESEFMIDAGEAGNAPKQDATAKGNTGAEEVDANLLDDSPFDLIVDKMTTKFIHTDTNDQSNDQPKKENQETDTKNTNTKN
nr:hypothetical protein [Candidatus Sigynarchaeota archaeon]